MEAIYIMKHEIMEWLKALVSSIVIVGIILFFVRPTLVKGDSMFPTIKEHNYLIIEKMSYRFGEPEAGDIIVFKSELKENSFKNKDLIKRVIGVPGDHIQIMDGIVVVNGEAIKEEYINEPYTFGSIDIEIPEEKVFVMGDNRQVSRDSRDSAVGLVSFDKIRGKIWVRLYPFNKIGPVK